MRRVARGPVVILTFDPQVSARMWLIADYLPEVAELDRRTCPRPETLARWLGGEVDVREVPISRDSPDWSLGSFWAHPERVLDTRARSSPSGFARMPPAGVDRRGGLGVERACRLVGEEEPRLVRERAGERDALALPAREGRRPARRAVREPDLVEELACTPYALDTSPAAPHHRHLHVLGGREHGNEVVELEDEADGRGSVLGGVA